MAGEEKWSGDEQGLLNPQELFPARRLPGTRTRLLHNKAFVDFVSIDQLGLGDELSKKRELFGELESGGLLSSGPLLQGGLSATALLAMRRLAIFFGFERALLFPSKNQAYWTLASTTLREGDTVFVDEAMQSALTDVAELIGAKTVFVRLDRVEELRTLLSSASLQGQQFLFLESVSAYDFTQLAPEVLECLRGFPHLKVVVDETGAFSLVGIRGAGVFDGVSEPERFAIIVDFSQVFGLPLTGLLINEETFQSLLGRSVFLRQEVSANSLLSQALVHLLDACELALDRRESLGKRAEELRRQLPPALGVATSPSFPSFPIRFQIHADAREFSRGLMSRQILSDVRSSTIARDGGAVVRLRLARDHTKKDSEKLLESIEELLKRGSFRIVNSLTI